MKRGQVTLFIILGLVLLIGTIITVAIYNDWLTERPPDEYVIDEPTTELQPLLSMIEQCQQLVLEQAVRPALAGGGYIAPEDHGIVAQPAPGGRGASTGGHVVPYWHYLEQGQALSEQPPLYSAYGDSVAQEINTYVDEHLESCMDWEAFPQYTITTTQPRSATAFREGRTILTTYMNMSVETPQGTKRFDHFTTEIDAPVYDLYTTAEDIIEHLMKTQKPESYALEWLGVYAVGHTNDLPPIHGEITTGHGFSVWPLPNALDDLQDVLARAAERLQFMGSRDAEIVLTGDERVNNLHLEGLIPVENADDITIRAFAPDSDPYLTANGNRGVAAPVITQPPGFLQAFMAPTVDYRFALDITHPLILRLEKNGYTMLVAYELNIDNNAPQTPLPRQEEASFCSNPGGSQLNLYVQPAVDAPVVYTCGAETCYLGDTRNGELRARLPACAAGSIEVYDPDSFSDSVTATSTNGADITETIRLYQPRPTQLVVKKRRVIPADDGAYRLQSQESFVEGRVLLMRQGRALPYQPDENNVVDLVPGRYDILVLHNTPIQDNPVIPEERRCFDANGNLLPGGDECFTIDAVNFTELPTLYLELKDVPINEVGDRLVLVGAGITIDDLETVEDLGLLGGMFELGADMDPEDAVRIEND